MGSLPGHVLSPTMRAKDVILCTMLVSQPALSSTTCLRSGFGRCNSRCNSRWRTLGGTKAHQIHTKRRLIVQCTSSSSPNDSGSRAENFKENDDDYVNSTVIEAVEVKSSNDSFTIKLGDGKFLKCVHNNPQAGHMPDYAPHPAIVLKMEDGSGLLLPIIVLEMPSVLLMAAIRNVHIARPTMYHVIKEMVEKMGYAVKLVRVTRRVHEAYFAQIYLYKIDNEEDCISFDLRPSDAINIAVRCKAPIQVNKHLAYSDGMKIVETARPLSHGPGSDGFIITEMDRSSTKTNIETIEFNLLRKMVEAAGEERYQDAARWRDELMRHRAKRNWA